MNRLLNLSAALLLTQCVLAQPPGYVPTNGLVGWWPFNGNANDESGNGHDGSVHGALLTTDRFGAPDSAYSFNGLTDYIACGSTNLPDSNEARSISLWILSDDFPQNDAFDANQGFSYGTATDGADNEVYFWRSGEDYLRYSGFGAANNLDVALTYEVQTWYHVATTYDGTTASIYFNGAMVGYGDFPGWNTVLDSVLFGTYPSRLNYHQGKVDDTGLWSRVLEPCEIQGLYNAGEQGISPTPVSYSGLNSSYLTSDSPVMLAGTPAGGVFIGPGVTGSTFDPAVAGPGTHSIIYTYVDECGAVNSAGACTEVVLNVGEAANARVSDGLRIYPNPNHGQFTVELELKGLVSLQVFDARGRQVYNEVFQANGSHTQRVLDLSGLAKGGYTVQVQNAGAMVNQQVVVE